MGGIKASSMGSVYIDPSPSFMQNSTSLQAAYRNDTLGFGFSGSGFLVFYFTGVVAVLRALGVINNSTALAGSSGGGLVSAAVCSQIDLTRQFRGNLELAAACRPSGCRGSLGTKVAELFAREMPPTAVETCKDKLFVSLTRARPNVPKNLTDPAVLVTKIPSRSLLIQALKGTSWLPFWSGPSATIEYARDRVYDGGFSVPLPCPPGLPHPGGVSFCVKVSATPPDEADNSTSSPDAEAERLMATLGFLTAGNKTDNSSRTFLPLNPQVHRIPKPDIYPGLSGPLSISTDLWNSIGLLIPDNTTLLYVHNQGRKDAAYWAKQSGLVSVDKVKQALAATEIKATIK